jgi:D-3-phosphoglycerate dehydrogenase
MAYTVLIPQPIAEDGKDYLRERGYEIKIGSGHTPEIMVEEIKGCDALLIRTAPVTREVLEAGTRLKVIGRHGTGVDNIDIQAATDLGIYVTNAPESNANSVAEHAIGLMIACARNFIRVNRALVSGNFEIRNQIIGVDLEKKIVGIIGLGQIGALVAKKAVLGFDMKVIAYDPFVDVENLAPGIELVDKVDDVFQRADFVTLHLPSTPETKGMVGKREFAMMKPSAYLINTARGDLINETELVEALETDQIAGGGFDVFAQEPPPKVHPLFKLENVILTPHNATLTSECMVRLALHAAMGIDDVLSGRKPKWPVNKPELVS